MAVNYAYNFAEIDPTTGMCIGMHSTTSPGNDHPDIFIPVPEYNEDYVFKYYINGAWYEDAAGTIPWSPDGV